MQSLIRKLKLLPRDEAGGEVIEYALIAGLIIVATVVVLGKIGVKVFARWSSVNSSL